MDPQIKGTLLQLEYSDGDTRLARVQVHIHELYLAQKAPIHNDPPRPQSQQSSVKSRSLQKVYKTIALMSNIDRYFDSSIVEWDGEDNLDWLLKWWKKNEDLYPLMS